MSTDLQTVTLHIEDTGGEGRPVILIHGWPLSGKAWERQVPALAAAGFRVITYDRRGFGESDKPETGYTYDSMAGDLAKLMEDMDLRDATLVGFSMGGGEVARYVANYGEERLRSVVFAAAVPPFLMQTADNPNGPLTEDAAKEMEAGLRADRTEFFDSFTKAFFSSNGTLQVAEADRQNAIALCHQSSQSAALGCMEAFGTTDFRPDLPHVTVPTLVLHGDADAIVPLEGSGALTHDTVAGSELVVLRNAPHGCNVSHSEDFNAALIAFLKR